MYIYIQSVFLTEGNSIQNEILEKLRGERGEVYGIQRGRVFFIIIIYFWRLGGLKRKIKEFLLKKGGNWSVFL